MATGKQHTRATLALTAVSATVCHIYDLSQLHTLGVVTGVFLRPDLDVEKGNITYAYMRKIGLEWLWSAWWRRYAVVCQHRSVVSHSIPFGTLIRFFYFFWPALLVMAFVPGSVFYWSPVVGLMAADALHVVMDIYTEIVAGLKRLRK